MTAARGTPGAVQAAGVSVSPTPTPLAPRSPPGPHTGRPALAPAPGPRRARTARWRSQQICPHDTASGKRFPLSRVKLGSCGLFWDRAAIPTWPRPVRKSAELRGFRVRHAPRPLEVRISHSPLHLAPRWRRAECGPAGWNWAQRPHIGARRPLELRSGVAMDRCEVGSGLLGLPDETPAGNIAC
jgi:hypothetical protein